MGFSLCRGLVPLTTMLFNGLLQLLQPKVLAVYLDGMRMRGTENDSISFGNSLLGQVLLEVFLASANSQGARYPQDTLLQYLEYVSPFLIEIGLGGKHFCFTFLI